MPSIPSPVTTGAVASFINQPFGSRTPPCILSAAPRYRLTLKALRRSAASELVSAGIQSPGLSGPTAYQGSPMREQRCQSGCTSRVLNDAEEARELLRSHEQQRSVTQTQAGVSLVPHGLTLDEHETALCKLVCVRPAVERQLLLGLEDSCSRMLARSSHKKPATAFVALCAPRGRKLGFTTGSQFENRFVAGHPKQGLRRRSRTFGDRRVATRWLRRPTRRGSLRRHDLRTGPDGIVQTRSVFWMRDPEQPDQAF